MGRSISKTSLRFRAWTMSPSFISTPGLRRLIPAVGCTSTGHSPIKVYFRLSKRCTSSLTAGHNNLALEGGGLYMVHSVRSEREDLDPVSCWCSGGAIRVTQAMNQPSPGTEEKAFRVLEQYRRCHQAIPCTGPQLPISGHCPW